MAGISLDFSPQACRPEHQAPARGPGGDQVQRVAALGPLMAAPGGLTVDGDDIGSGVAQLVDPCREAGLEVIGRQGVDDVVKRVTVFVMRGDTLLKGQKAAQKIELPVGPEFDLNEILGSGHRCAEHDQQHLRQRVGHLPGLARVIKGGKMVEQTGRGHQRPHQFDTS